jgi:hypothetical protein
LRTSTLAEEATLQELKAARAKAKADALLRAQRIAMEDDEDEFNNANVEEEVSNPVILKVKEAATRKKPIMPLRKLAAKVNRGEASEEKESPMASHGEATPAEAREPAEFVINLNSEPATEIEKVEGQSTDAGAAEESRNNNGEDEAELEGIIAKLRKEALDRRLYKIHKAQKDVAKSAGKNKVEPVDNEAKIRRPGIVKSRKVSTKEDYE